MDILLISEKSKCYFANHKSLSFRFLLFFFLFSFSFSFLSVIVSNARSTGIVSGALPPPPPVLLSLSFLSPLLFHFFLPSPGAAVADLAV